MPDPPKSADLKARIIADIKRSGQSLITYAELRAAWPDDFATVRQITVIAMLAREEKWNFEFATNGVRFTPATK